MLPFLASPYRYSRHYRGPLKACILDWSGTTADKYVIAPAEVFCKVFEKHKVPITMEEARGPMGLRKDLHIKEITKIPAVKKRWFEVHDRFVTDHDVNAMFSDFVPMQLECLKKYSTLLPGVAHTVTTLKNNYNLKIGSTTGFTEVMVDVLRSEAEKQGYYLDSSVAGNSVLHGARPSPHMIYKNLDNLGINPIQSVLKVDDTVGGVGEGLEAGCWTVGVSRYSNYMNINTLEEEDTLSEEEIEYRHNISRDILLKSGAHYVVDDITYLPKIVEDINKRLVNGEKP